MTHILLFLKRDWYAFRKNFFTYILLWIVIPISIHLLIAIPLSRFITLEIRFLNWAAAGVWFSSSGIVAFLESSITIHSLINGNQILSILKSPVSNINILLAIIIRGIIFGYIQFIIAFGATCALNHEYFSMLSISLLFIQMLGIVLFFSTLGILIGLVISQRILFIQFSFILFILISLGMGGFIPINYYPESYIIFINKLPIMNLLSNLQAIIIHQKIQWLSFFITIISSIIIFITTLIISNKIFRKI